MSKKKKRLKIKNLYIAEKLTDYWRKHYATDHCTLCGNRGIIDTSSAITAAGLRVGRTNYCICPNGQAMRKAKSVYGVGNTVQGNFDDTSTEEKKDGE